MKLQIIIMKINNELCVCFLLLLLVQLAMPTNGRIRRNKEEEEAIMFQLFRSKLN